MANIAQQITELNNQKNSLADNINTMGVSANRNEKLNTLVPKVLQIPHTSGTIPKLSLPRSITKMADGSTKTVTAADFGYTSDQVEVVTDEYLYENGVWKFYTSITSAIFQLNMPVLLKPKFGYAWDDDTYDTKLVYWSVDKLPANLSADIYSPEYGVYEVTLNGANCIAEINLSYDSPATPNITLNGNIISGGDINTTYDVKLVNKKLYIIGYIGGGYITVTLPETDCYYSDIITINVKIGEESLKHICGAKWDGSSSSAWTRTDLSAMLDEPVPYVLNAENYDSPYDNLYPWAGMKQVTRSCGEMVSIPKFWYKLESYGNGGLKVQIADYPAEGFHVSPAHMDRGDGKGERDMVYVGRYHCSTDNYISAAYNSSGTALKPKVNITRSDARTAIKGLNPDQNKPTIWICDFATRFTIWILFIVEHADWDSQSKIGRGCSKTSANGSAVYTMGYTDTMPYHTGTTQTLAAKYGGTQYRYIEGLWDNCLDWLDGCYYNANGLNIILKPDDFDDSSNGTSVGIPANGYPTKFSVKDNIPGTYPIFIPSAAGGSNTTYTRDNWGFDAAKQCVSTGGTYWQMLDRGLFHVYASSTTVKGASTGTRLMELP